MDYEKEKLLRMLKHVKNITGDYKSIDALSTEAEVKHGDEGAVYTKYLAYIEFENTNLILAYGPNKWGESTEYVGTSVTKTKDIFNLNEPYPEVQEAFDLSEINIEMLVDELNSESNASYIDLRVKLDKKELIVAIKLLTSSLNNLNNSDYSPLKNKLQVPYEQVVSLESEKSDIVNYSKPVLTDPSCSQVRIDNLDRKNEEFIFSQYETFNPKTGELILRTETIDLADYSYESKVDACDAFGVKVLETEPVLLAEYLFELGV